VAPPLYWNWKSFSRVMRTLTVADARPVVYDIQAGVELSV
jgi:hypothetical protein